MWSHNYGELRLAVQIPVAIMHSKRDVQSSVIYAIKLFSYTELRQHQTQVVETFLSGRDVCESANREWEVFATGCFLKRSTI